MSSANLCLCTGHMTRPPRAGSMRIRPTEFLFTLPSQKTSFPGHDGAEPECSCRQACGQRVSQPAMEKRERALPSSTISIINFSDLLPLALRAPELGVLAKLRVLVEAEPDKFRSIALYDCGWNVRGPDVLELEVDCTITVHSS